MNQKNFKHIELIEQNYYHCNMEFYALWEISLQNKGESNSLFESKM